jgi:hypothetical protein
MLLLVLLTINCLPDDLCEEAAVKRAAAAAAAVCVCVLM